MATTDYTQRDFAAILTAMRNDAQSKVPEWTNFNPGEFGTVLLELFAGSLDILSYSLDRAANETFLDTAITKQSVQSILRLIGYTMKRRIAASVQLRLQLANGATAPSTITIPKGTLVRSSSGLSFVTVVDAQILAGSNTALGEDVNGVPNQDFTLALQGQFNDHDISPSGNNNELTYRLPVINVAENLLIITVNGVTWTNESALTGGLITGEDRNVYRTFEDIFGYTYVQFSSFIGDVPALTDVIHATYVSTDGKVGNVGASTVTTIPAQPSSMPLGYSLVVTNPAQATGGSERESVAEAKVNGPRTLRTLDRAVTLQDYIDLLLEQPGVESVSAANHPGYVELYVRPVRNLDGTFPQFKVEAPILTQAVANLGGGTISGSGLYGHDVFVAFTSVDANGNESSFIAVEPATGGILPNVAKLKQTSTGSVSVRLAGMAEGAVSVNVYVGSAVATDPTTFPTTLPTMRRYATGILPAAIVDTAFVITSVPTTGAVAPVASTAGYISPDTGRSLYQTLYDFLAVRVGLGISYDLFEPLPTFLSWKLSVYVKDNYRQSTTKAAVEVAIASFFNVRPIGESFYYSDLEQFIFATVPGVRNVAVIRSSGDDGLVPIDVGEYPVLTVVTGSPDPANDTVLVVGGLNG